MHSPVNPIRLSKAAAGQLMQLRQMTSIGNWTVLCRWALCRSLAEPTNPAPVSIAADSTLEMSGRVLGGPVGDILLKALRQRCHESGLSPDHRETLATQLQLHLHRGIHYLAGDPNIQSTESLMALVSDNLKSVQASMS
ncbi:hypothetical protein XM38_000680 [Halomicronema hongdechloris C2206]|uniref:DNA sulfur modification protein DndE n=1 Tax=Halomicronema hongdechloris C2206 TaxID=1641165 RepID=A0A1Z3HFT7_9CYAN|nr:DNA sulfur modification protein DndE [Halomicronema hongdechloris]ASC69142.1 hypothetical protein XM38_000680 [Halomicronema hongdechloris C2206]